MWSEHCAYKHSKKLLRRLPTEGEHVLVGPARTPARSTSATGSRSRSRSSRTTTRARSSRSRARPPASAGSCATSSRSARGRSRCSTRCASASPRDSERSRYLLERAVAGIGHYGNSIGVPTVGGEIYFDQLRAELPDQRDVPSASRPRAADPQRRGRPRQRARPARRADRARRDRRRLGARERRARRRATRTSALGPDRRPVRREEADGVLPRAARPRPARLAAGPRRRRPDLVRESEMASKGGSASTSTSPRAAARAGTWSRSRSWSPSRRSGCCASSSPTSSAT
jgi:hypothetical protein